VFILEIDPIRFLYKSMPTRYTPCHTFIYSHDMTPELSKIFFFSLYSQTFQQLVFILHAEGRTEFSEWRFDNAVPFIAVAVEIKHGDVPLGTDKDIVEAQ